MHPYIQLFLILSGLYLLVIWGPRRLRRQREMRRQMKQRQKDQVDKHLARDAIESALVDFHELSRQMTAQLDTKISLLKELLFQADEKIRKLENFSQIEVSSDGEEVANIKISEESSKDSSFTRLQQLRQRHEAVFNLLDRGESLENIAKQTGQPIGEIKLLAGMQKQHPASS
jgi:hypothetical protein